MRIAPGAALRCKLPGPGRRAHQGITRAILPGA